MADHLARLYHPGRDTAHDMEKNISRHGAEQRMPLGWKVASRIRFWLREHLAELSCPMFLSHVEQIPRGGDGRHRITRAHSIADQKLVFLYCFSPQAAQIAPSLSTGIIAIQASRPSLGGVHYLYKHSMFDGSPIGFAEGIHRFPPIFHVGVEVLL